MQASSSGRVNLDFEPDPTKTFNRGYTSYFLTGERDQIASPETPKHAGEPIGVITKLGQHSFTLNVPAPLNNGDGLTYFDQDGQLQGTQVNRVEGAVVFPAKMGGLHLGAQIRRNADREFLKQLEKSQPDRKIPLKMRFLGNRRWLPPFSGRSRREFSDAPVKVGENPSSKISSVPAPPWNVN